MTRRMFWHEIEGYPMLNLTIHYLLKNSYTRREREWREWEGEER